MITSDQCSGSDVPAVVHLRGWHDESQIATLSLSPMSAISHVSRQPLRELICHGFFEMSPEQTMTAVFAYQGRMFLQIGIHRWDILHDHVRVTHRPCFLNPFKNSVSVYTGWRRRFHITYESHAFRAIWEGDPTFDSMDEEMSDWWLWLSRVVLDAKTLPVFVAAWEKGM
jgi:hypothetical protein